MTKRVEVEVRAMCEPVMFVVTRSSRGMTLWPGVSVADLPAGALADAAELVAGALSSWAEGLRQQAAAGEAEGGPDDARRAH